MDTSQRAMLATEMLPEFEAQAKERIETSRDEGGRYAPFVSVDTNGKPNYNETTATAEAAKEFNVARVTVARAKRVKEQAPEKVADIVAGKTSVRAVDTELREARAEKRHEERKGRADTKTVKEHPKVVKEYFDAVHQYRDGLKLAIMSAQRGMFAPEAMQMVRTRHDELRSLMAELENI